MLIELDHLILNFNKELNKLKDKYVVALKNLKPDDFKSNGIYKKFIEKINEIVIHTNPSSGTSIRKSDVNPRDLLSNVQDETVEFDLDGKILKTIPDLFFMVSSEGAILAYKGKEEDLYLPPKEFLGKKVTEIFPKDLAFHMENAIKRTIETQEPNNLIYSLPLKKMIRHYEARIIYFSKNEVAVFIRDITEYKLNEQRLKESEERLSILNAKLMNRIKISQEKYRHLFETSPFSVIIINQKGIVENCNDSTQKIFGYQKSELLGKDILELFQKNILQPFLKKFNKLIKGKILEPIELQIRKKDGDKIWIQSHRNIVELENKLLIQVIIQDITAKKEAEHKLSESEKKYRHLFENSPFSILMLDLSGKIIACNPALEKLTGYHKEEIIGLKYKNSSLIPSKFFPGIIERGQELINRVDQSPWNLQFYRKDGSLRWINLRSTLARIGNEPYFLVICYDITEKKESEEKLKSHTQKLEVLNKIIISGNKAKDLSLLIKKILSSILDLMNFDGGGIYLMDKSEKIAFLACHEGLPLDFVEEVKIAEITEKNYEGVFIKDESIFTENYHEINSYRSNKWGFLSLATIPLQVKNKIIGAFNIVSKSRYTFSNEEKDLLMSIGRELATVIARMQAEEALKESEEKFRTISEQLLLGIFIIQDSEVKYINEAAALINEYSREEILSWKAKEFAKIIHPDDLQYIMGQERNLRNGESNKTLKHFTYKVITKSGKLKWIEQYSKAITYDGRPATLNISHDITERKLIEEKLRKSENKYRNLVTTSPNSIILLDIKGIIIECNEKTEKYLELPLIEIIGKNIIELFPIKRTQVILKRAIKYQMILKNAPFEIEFINRSDRKMWLEIFISSIDIGDINYIQFVMEDISARKKAELIVKKENIKLKELDKIKSEFIYRASHELKTPLNSIYSASTLLMDLYKDDFDERAERLTKIIIKGSERLEHLIKDLLDTSQIEAGKLKLEKRRENIVEIIKDCINDTNYLVEDREQTLNFNVEVEILVNVDRIRIEQVILNLLTNAIKYTPPKGTIFVSISKHANYVDIIVRDTGVGFTATEKSKIFQKFGKLERYGKGMHIDTEGTGLGLYISREIVHLHGGKIWLESKGRNQGSIFTIRLP